MRKAALLVLNSVAHNKPAAVREQLPDTLLASFTMPSGALSLILFFSLLGSIVVTGLLLGRQLARGGWWRLRDNQTVTVAGL